MVAASFICPFEADLARLRLEYEGIRARLADEAIAGWVWHYSQAVGGVKVLVRAENWPRAVEILEGESETPPDESRPGAVAAGPDAETPRRWACPRCGARVPAGFAVCWACGAASDGTEDPDFPTADALIVEHDPDQPRSAWWPIVCLVILPMAIYEMLDSVLPDRAEPRGRVRRRVSYAAVDRRLIRACLAAIFAVGWFPPFAFVSLWLLPGVECGRGARRVVSRRLVWTAMALNLLYSVPLMLFSSVILYRAFYL